MIIKYLKLKKPKACTANGPLYMSSTSVIPYGEPESGIQHLAHGLAEVKTIDIGSPLQVRFQLIYMRGWRYMINFNDPHQMIKPVYIA